MNAASSAAVRVLLCIALVGIACQPPGAAAQPVSDEVTLNFVNTEIEGVVKVVSDITGRNFVLDPRVKGNISIVSAKPLPRDVVYDVFLSALRLQGFAAIETGNLVRIVPEADAKLYPGPTGGRDMHRPGDLIQTQVFRLRFAVAEQLVPILRPLIAPNNAIAAHAGNNTLVITDYANNLPRLARIIDSIDQPASSEPVVIPLGYASALDVAATVNRLFAESAQGGAVPGSARPFTVVADMRSNSILARMDDPARLGQLRRFVAMLDSPGNAGGNIHVVYLKNADAVKLAATLRAIYRGDRGRAQDEPSGAVLGANVPPEAGQSHAGDSDGIIQADAATNSIIITAPDATYNNLRAVLEKLDVRRAQVYVEALIAELTADKAAEFGVQWQNLGGLDGNGRSVFGGTNFGGVGENIIGISANPGSAGPGLNLGIINGRVNIPGIGEILNLGLLVRALETDANANILSTPTLLTLDNEEASIIIGQNVPFITGQYATTGTNATATPFQTIERHDVGLTLRVKPQISEGGTVRLQIYQEVSSINDRTNPAGVITNKRAVSSTVLVDDGQIVVIGGLIQDAITDGVNKVPVLGSIPGIGGLFRSKKRGHNKTNLMIFLRITLVRDSAQADAFTGNRYDYILGEQQRAQPPPSIIFPDGPSPTLPPREAPAPARMMPAPQPAETTGYPADSPPAPDPPPGR